LGVSKALKKLKKKTAKIAFERKENREKVLRALAIAKDGAELVAIVTVIKRLRGDKENQLALQKARQFKLDSIGWAVLFEKADDNSELKKVSDTMSYKLSPIYEFLRDDDDDDDDEEIESQI
jgi:hypothetical protein